MNEPDPLAAMRIEYGDLPLARADLPAAPLDLFRAWLADARVAKVSEPNGMTLATVDGEGQPHSRVVLLKIVDERGFTFFTNRASDKGRHLIGNPRAAATFWWPLPRNRQVRITGDVQPTDDATSDRYFAERPRRAQLCSAASPQSQPVEGRAELESLVAALEARLAGAPVPRPSHWGGYCLSPRTIEFWQGRDGRLHDRFRYERTTTGWNVERLAP